LHLLSANYEECLTLTSWFAGPYKAIKSLTDRMDTEMQALNLRLSK